VSRGQQVLQIPEVLKMKKKFRSVEVLKLAVDPEKVLTLGQCGAEKFILPAC